MDYLEINKEAWNRRTKTHVVSEFYDVKGFLNGNSSLREIELDEMDDVTGKSLLHLQCHFGLDTLSWARKGAIVTGVDLSPVAIEQANHLKEKTNIDAQFICSDIYEFGERATYEYDIVITTYGVLNWLPCLHKWANVISKSLKPGGTFYMVEFHPIYDLISGYSYFGSKEGELEEGSSYVEKNSGDTSKMVTWAHPMSEVVNSLIESGIQINRLNEFPFSPYNCFEGLEKKERGRFYLAKTEHETPLVFSIMGTKT